MQATVSNSVDFQQIIQAIPTMSPAELAALLTATATALTGERSIPQTRPSMPTPADTLPAKLAYNRAEAARHISVSPRTLDDLRRRGLLHPSCATGRPLYPVWELERFLRETSEQIQP